MGASPESRQAGNADVLDSGPAASRRPGMTTGEFLFANGQRPAPGRNDRVAPRASLRVLMWLRQKQENRGERVSTDALLVGSIPLDTVEDVFREFGGPLGASLK